MTIPETRGERIEKALGVALKAHRIEKDFLLDKIKLGKKAITSEVFISFPGSGSVWEWYSQKPFGEVPIDLALFPSLKSIGNNEAAKVNEAFQKRFQSILDKPQLASEVGKATEKNKQIVFTGYSSGAPMAILATLWTLDKYFPPKSHGGLPPLCVTFGSPLVGNHIFSHATNRENWSNNFIHFVLRYDIVPRILLAPLSCFDPNLEPISQFFNPKSKSFSAGEPVAAPPAETCDFYVAVMSNAATVTSHAACKLMGSTDTTLETVSNFVPMSPYRPFGTYVFCAENGKPVVVSNPDAILQLLFFSAQLSTDTDAEAARVANRGLQDHVAINVTKLQQMQGVVPLSQELLEKLPLNDGDLNSRDEVSIALNDLGLSTTARLCLRAAAELEKRRLNNAKKLEERKGFINEKLKIVEDYKEHWGHKMGYYDAFRGQQDPKDFDANVRRLELAGEFDGIIEKLRYYELPDGFEANKEWIDLGTRHRRLVEPLDVANYYRHLRQVDAGTYMIKGRPRRYRYPQRWLEHSKRTKAEEGYSESCFWAEVEDLRNMKDASFEDVKDRVVWLENKIQLWIENKDLGKDVFLEGSTLVKWWKTLPPQHRQSSWIKDHIRV